MIYPKLPLEYFVDTERILGNPSLRQPFPSRFQLCVKFPKDYEPKRRVNPQLYRGDHWFKEKYDQNTPEAQLHHLLNMFRRKFQIQRWVYAYLNDTLYEEKNRRNVLSYVNGIVEQNLLHNYYMMLQDFSLCELLQFEWQHNIDSEARTYHHFLTK